MAPSLELHIGCGDAPLPGWTNIDLMPYPGVDRVLDVTKPLPFENVDFIFAEHFIEHLAFEDGAKFLRECRRALKPDGVLRLSTPNLTWVWATQYRHDNSQDDDASIRDCFNLNRGFYGWGHQFLYNRATLAAALKHAGFASVESLSYGQSGEAELRGLERHEKFEDSPDLPHVLIFEARGLGPLSDDAIDRHSFEFKRDTHMPWHLAQYAMLASVRIVSRFLRKVGIK